jgi:hypothetical protein
MAPGAPGMDQPPPLKCRWRLAIPSAAATRRRRFSLDDRTCSAWGTRARSIQHSAVMRVPRGASLGRADPELVKLSAPVLLPSAPDLCVWRLEEPYINNILIRAHRASVVVRMLRAGYMSQKSYHFLTRLDRLAQVLHCLMETVACPMGRCADADSRAGYRQRFYDVGVTTGVPAVPQTI